MKNILRENMRRFKTKNLNEQFDTTGDNESDIPSDDVELDIEYLNDLLDGDHVHIPSTWFAKWFNKNITKEMHPPRYIRKYNKDSMEKFGESLQSLFTALDYVTLMKRKLPTNRSKMTDFFASAMIHRGFPQIDFDLKDIIRNSGTRKPGKFQRIPLKNATAADIKRILKNPEFIAAFPNAEPFIKTDKPKTDPIEPRGKGYDADGMMGG